MVSTEDTRLCRGNVSRFTVENQEKGKESEKSFLLRRGRVDLGLGTAISIEFPRARRSSFGLVRQAIYELQYRA